MVGENPTQLPRNCIGLIGTALALLGMFLPYIEFWFASASLFDYLADEAGLLLPVIFILLVLAFILFLCSVSHGRWIGALLLIGLLVVTFGDDSGMMDLIDITDYLRCGFWIMVIGLILMIVSPSLLNANRKMESLFAGESIHQPERFKPVGLSPTQWICTNCGRKNPETGKFCPSCGTPKPERPCCPNCGKPVTAGDTFCMYCRTKLPVNLAASAASKDNLCPLCGKPLVDNKFFCSYCHVNFEDGIPPKPEKADPPAVKAPVLGNFTSYQGFWQWNVDSAGIPEWELIVSNVFTTSFVFTLTHKNGFVIPAQTATVTGEESAEFETADGPKISGVFSFEGDMILLFILRSEEATLPAGKDLIFNTRSDRRAL